MMMMAERRNAYFIAVATTGSLRKASENLNIASSAISRQIALLEDELKCTLFERSAHGMTITEAGRIYLNYVTASWQEAERVRSELRAISDLEQGHVRIASVQGLATDIIARTVALFTRKYPSITYDVNIMSSDDVVESVINRTVDIGISVNASATNKVETIMSVDNSIVAVVSPTHPLADVESIDFEELLTNYSSALLASGFGIRRFVDEWVAGKRRPTMESNSVDVLRSFAIHGCGFAILPRLAVMKDLEDGILASVPVKNLSDRRATLDVYVISGRSLPVAVTAFTSALKDANAEEIEGRPPCL